jgi:hypothetical protein
LRRLDAFQHPLVPLSIMPETTRACHVGTRI